MKILLTGGAGLIGIALRRHLAAQGHEVTATDITDFGRDDPALVILPLSDAARIEQLIQSRGIEAIIHSGAISSPSMARSEPMRVVEVNIDATAHLLDMARRHGLRRFVFLSSHVVYGHVGPGRIDEQSPLHPGSTYAASKVAGEALVESFSREFGLSAASLRLTRVYGPYRRDDCFMRAMVLDAAAGRMTTIPCDPDFRYHYIHVDDVAEAAMAALLANQPQHGIYNVTSGEALTMPAIVEIARQALPGARIEMVPGVDGAPEVQRDFTLERAASELGWRPRFGLLRGLADYAAQMPESQTIG